MQRSSFGRPRLVDGYFPLLHELLYLAKVAVVGSLVQLRVRRHLRRRLAASRSKVEVLLFLSSIYSKPDTRYRTLNTRR